jgi:hypothetical protein
MRGLLPCLLLLPVPAWAAWPDDVVVSGMLEHAGQPVTPEAARAGLRQVVRDLGSAAANKPLWPARTLGSAGFDLSLGATVVPLSTGAADGSGGPSGWALAHADEDPATVAVLPTLSARKGLPSSLEVGASAAWHGLTRQGVLSGFARLAPIEGYEPWPDLVFQVGYAGYIGNPELELGTLDATASLGGTFAFGSFPGIRQAEISLWAGGGLLVIHARPVVDDATEAALYAGAVDVDPEDPARTRLDPLPQLHGGLQITNSTVLFRLVGAWSPAGVPSVHAGMGFMF